MNKLNYFFLGLGVFLVGFFVCVIIGGLFGGSSETSFLTGIIFAIIYLSSVISVCTVALINNKK